MDIVLLALSILFLSVYGTYAEVDPKFRMEKINFVWAKVNVHVRDPQVLNELEKSLNEFDQLYLAIKQDKTHQKETRKLSEVDAQLVTLLKEHDLEDVVHAFRMKYKNKDEKIYAEQLSSNLTNVELMDERVAQLWKSIESRKDLPADELEEIRHLLIRQDARCSEYNELLKHHKQTTTNHIYSHDEHERLTGQVKQLNQEVESEFDVLRNRINELLENPFKNVKIRQLWDETKRNQHLIPNESEMIKAELHHLDRHWDKVDYHVKYTAVNQDNLKSLGYDGDDVDVQTLQEHQQMLQRKLKKLTAYLHDKLVTHSEL